MSLNEILGQLRGQQPPAPFAPAELVRRRGRQRNHRQALTAGAAVLAVAGAGAGVFALPDRPNGPEPLASPSPVPVSPASPSPVSPSAAPTPSVAPRPTFTAVLPAFLLQPADLGPGSWSKFSPEVFEGPEPWYWSDACPGYDSSDYRSLPRQRDVEVIGYRSGQDTVVEVVELYAPGYGAASLADVRALIAFCAAATPPPGTAPNRNTIVGTGFAGDESILVKHEAWFYQGETIAPDPFISYVAVVRVGDLVATVRAQKGGEEYIRTLAVKAAARLG